MNLNVQFPTAGRGRGKNRDFKGKKTHVITIQRGSINKRAPKRKCIFDSSSPSTSMNWRDGTRYTSLAISESEPSFSNSSSESRMILAITEGRGEASYEVGIAAVNITKPVLILCQISDTQSYMNVLTKINVLTPVEIIMPVTMSHSRLAEKIKQHFQDVKITGVQRSSFNKNNGLQYVKNLCAPAWNSIVLVLQYKYYALTATSALLRYIETHLYTFYAKESIKVEYQESEGFTIIDVVTADKLELVSCAINNNSKYSSLRGVLNNCVTKIGSRTLRASILQPPSSLPEIEARLNCVEELISKSDKISYLQSLLKQIANVDQLLSLSTIIPNKAQECSTQKLNYVLLLNSLFDLLEPLRDAFDGMVQPFFVELQNLLGCEDLLLLKNLLRELIHANARPGIGEQAIIERCFAIKSGVYKLLDIIRMKYSERLDSMREYVKDLGKKYNLELRLANNTKKGYHVTLKLGAHERKCFKKSDLPEEFIQVERMTTVVTMKTTEILTFSARLEDIIIEIVKMSNILIHNTLIEIHKKISLFYKLCEDIAKLDMLLSLAQFSTDKQRYVRPKFNDFMEIVNGRHPLLEYLSDTEPIGNDVYASSFHNMHIITGPNGSGKSIYMRQIVLLQIMAQIGCFVPATSAVFRVADRILARIQLEDNMDCGASAFVLEMKEIQYFLTVVSNNTLIIIDELCRSTSINEGTTLAMAICERFLATNAFVFFTTHYTFITKLYDMYLNVKCWQLESKEVEMGERKKLMFTYNVLPGIITLEDYAIYLAKASWPDIVIEDVEYILTHTNKSKMRTEVWKIDPRLRLKYELESQFQILKMKSELTYSIIGSKLQDYQEDLRNIGSFIDWNKQTKPNRKQTVVHNHFIEEENQHLSDELEYIFPKVVYSDSSSTMEDIENLQLEDVSCEVRNQFLNPNIQYSQVENNIYQQCSTSDEYCIINNNGAGIPMKSYDHDTNHYFEVDENSESFSNDISTKKNKFDIETTTCTKPELFPHLYNANALYDAKDIDNEDLEELTDMNHLLNKNNQKQSKYLEHAEQNPHCELLLESSFSNQNIEQLLYNNNDEILENAMPSENLPFSKVHSQNKIQQNILVQDRFDQMINQNSKFMPSQAPSSKNINVEEICSKSPFAAENSPRAGQNLSNIRNQSFSICKQQTLKVSNEILLSPINLTAHNFNNQNSPNVLDDNRSQLSNQTSAENDNKIKDNLNLTFPSQEFLNINQFNVGNVDLLNQSECFTEDFYSQCIIPQSDVELTDYANTKNFESPNFNILQNIIVQHKNSESTNNYDFFNLQLNKQKCLFENESFSQEFFTPEISMVNLTLTETQGLPQFEDSKANIEFKDSKANIEFEDSKANIEFEDSKANIEFEDSKANIEFEDSKANIELEDSKANVETSQLSMRKQDEPKYNSQRQEMESLSEDSAQKGKKSESQSQFDKSFIKDLASQLDDINLNKSHSEFIKPMKIIAGSQFKKPAVQQSLNLSLTSINSAQFSMALKAHTNKTSTPIPVVNQEPEISIEELQSYSSCFDEEWEYENISQESISYSPNSTIVKQYELKKDNFNSTIEMPSVKDRTYQRYNENITSDKSKNSDAQSSAINSICSQKYSKFAYASKEDIRQSSNDTKNINNLTSSYDQKSMTNLQENKIEETSSNQLHQISVGNSDALHLNVCRENSNHLTDVNRKSFDSSSNNVVEEPRNFNEITLSVGQETSRNIKRMSNEESSNKIAKSALNIYQTEVELKEGEEEEEINSNLVAISSKNSTYPSQYEDCLSKSRLSSVSNQMEDIKADISENNSVISYCDNLKRLKSDTSFEFKRKCIKFRSPLLEKPIFKMTKREIEASFLKQDLKFFESDGNNYDEILNRPSVKQIRASKKLTTVYKRKDGGSVVVENEQGVSKKRKKFMPPLKNSAGIKCNVSIFSDQNSGIYEQFIQSKKDSELESQILGQMYNKSSSINHSASFQSAQSSGDLPFTPDGYYKQNKKEIESIIKKYV